jgi:hypothetical protein
MLTLLGAPLIFGLQRFGVFKPRLWHVLVACAGMGLVLQLAFGDKATFYVGYFIALPLLVAGLVVLVASFLIKRRRGGEATEVASVNVSNAANHTARKDHEA